jgi:hypothetical protein
MEEVDYWNSIDEHKVVQGGFDKLRGSTDVSGLSMITQFGMGSTHNKFLYR